MAALGEVVRQQLEAGSFVPVTAARLQLELPPGERSPDAERQPEFARQMREELLRPAQLPPGPLMRLFGRRVTPGAQAALRAAAAAAAVTAAASK